MSLRVAIVMGSASDEPTMRVASETLLGLGIESEMRVLSAHRTPEALREWVQTLEPRGVRIVICGAGGAAHLAGAVAALTTLPVIGVPLAAPNSIGGGLDALRRGGRLAYPNGIEPEPRKRRGVEVSSYDASPGVREFRRFNRAVEAANLRVPIEREYTLAHAAAAHRRLARGGVLGKIILRIR